MAYNIFVFENQKSWIGEDQAVKRLMATVNNIWDGLHLRHKVIYVGLATK